MEIKELKLRAYDLYVEIKKGQAAIDAKSLQFQKLMNEIEGKEQDAGQD